MAVQRRPPTRAAALPTTSTGAGPATYWQQQPSSGQRRTNWSLTRHLSPPSGLTTRQLTAAFRADPVPLAAVGQLRPDLQRRRRVCQPGVQQSPPSAWLLSSGTTPGCSSSSAVGNKGDESWSGPAHTLDNIVQEVDVSLRLPLRKLSYGPSGTFPAERAPGCPGASAHAPSSRRTHLPHITGSSRGSTGDRAIVPPLTVTIS
jgi:hypothetical protein